MKIPRNMCSVLVFFVFLASLAVSAPHVNERFELLQPDGTTLPVIVNGDEFYQRVEDLHGRTLIRDDEGWMCYASLNDDSTDFIPGERYTDTAASPAVAAKPHRELKESEILRRVEERRKILHHDDFATTLADDAPGKEVTGDQKGLTLLVDFSDQEASVNQNHMDELVNGESFETYGSVWEYFYDISGEKLNYKNHVTDYIRAEKQKSYYDDPDVPYGERARELIHEMLDSLYYSGFDFTQLSMEGDQIVAVNLFYAGSPDHGWSKGLWPHMSSRLGWTSPDGSITTGSYQITNIGTSPSIGTFCHENGHMLLDQPDLYPYSGDNNWVGSLCLMGSGGGSNPAPMNPYFRYNNGWVDLTDITDVESGTYSIKAHDMDSAVFYRSSHDSNQFYYIINVQKEGRWAHHAGGSGMKVWRINANSDATNTKSEDNNPRAAVVGYSDNVYMSDRPDIAFSSTTTPAALWHEDVASGIELRNLSSSGAVMTFDVGTGATFYDLALTAENGSVETDPDGSSFEEDTEVELSAQADYGYEFSHWSGDISGSDAPVTVVMDGDKNITANFDPVTTYSLDVTAENGSVSLSPEYSEYVSGEEVELRVHPDAGYVFSGWEGDLSGDEYSATIVVDEDKDVQANFTAHGYASLNQSLLSVASVSSEDESGDGRPAANVLDGDNSTVWFTHWEDPAEEHPHEIVLALDTAVAVGGLRYTPRQDSENGRIDEYAVYLSADGEEWGEPVAEGFFTNSTDVQDGAFIPPQNEVSFIRLVALSEVNGEVWTSVADLEVLYDPEVPVIGSQKGASDVALHGSVLQITENAPLTVRISGVNGRLLKSVNTTGPRTINFADMGLSSGMYVLQIQNASGENLMTSQFHIR